jgi:hypothetical protein
VSSLLSLYVFPAFHLSVVCTLILIIEAGEFGRYGGELRLGPSNLIPGRGKRFVSAPQRPDGL